MTANNEAPVTRRALLTVDDQPKKQGSGSQEDTKRRLAAIILAPLAGALVIGLLGKRMGERLIGLVACRPWPFCDQFVLRILLEPWKASRGAPVSRASLHLDQRGHFVPMHR